MTYMLNGRSPVSDPQYSLIMLAMGTRTLLSIKYNQDLLLQEKCTYTILCMEVISEMHCRHGIMREDVEINSADDRTETLKLRHFHAYN